MTLEPSPCHTSITHAENGLVLDANASVQELREKEEHLVRDLTRVFHKWRRNESSNCYRPMRKCCSITYLNPHYFRR